MIIEGKNRYFLYRINLIGKKEIKIFDLSNNFFSIKTVLLMNKIDKMNATNNSSIKISTINFANKNLLHLK